MHELTLPTRNRGAAPDSLLAELTRSLRGEVRSDRLARALYATDASIYQIVPDAVVLPRDADDVAAALRMCSAHHTPITPRGAGTGLTGGAVNRGVQLDLSRHLTRVGPLDHERRTIRVDAGVVLDELNAQLRPCGLHFAPDVATSDRATIGGMIGNNSCGARSVYYGRTVDHVVELDAVLADGSRAAFGPAAPPNQSALARRAEALVGERVNALRDEIRGRYPRVLRSNGGYGLDRLLPDWSGHAAGVARPTQRLPIERLLCGSEGTLAVVVGATLNLTPLPACRGLAVLHFADLLECLAATPMLLAHSPAAIELLDKMILDASRGHPNYHHRRWFLDGDPAAVLIVEMFADSADDLYERLRRVAADAAAAGVGYACPIIVDPLRQADVWIVRKAGTGLLMCRPGDAQPYDFVDDCAVDPARLRDFIAEFRDILNDEGVREAGYYAHASVGCLHIRPALNLRDARDIARLRRIGERVSTLAVRFGGTFTGEHGDGLVRSEWLEKLYGPALMGAFAEVKRAFDPQGVLNPGKIVDAQPMDANLRQGAGFRTQSPATLLDFSTHGGMDGLAGMCSGLGHCRQRLVATMCPSYMATGDETHTVRARANALRLALSNHGLIDGLADPALDDVMDLCLSCKACKTECPTGVDMARLKAEWLHLRNEHRGVPLRARVIAAAPRMAAWGSRLAPLSNWAMQSAAGRWALDAMLGLDRRVPPPRFARKTFRAWFAARPAPPARDGPAVAYFVDTWTNHHEPSIGVAAVELLESLGRRVLLPPAVCCGRPAISKGLLHDAARLAEQNVAALSRLLDQAECVVTTEPSCLSAIVDEWPQLCRTDAARAVARRAMSVEQFACERIDALRPRLAPPPVGAGVVYHGHCHEKALFGVDAAMGLLRAAWGDAAAALNSGCCGMAGAFGHEREHYDVARAVGEQRLFPALRDRGAAIASASGFSCRHQIEHHLGVRPLHPVEIVAGRLRAATSMGEHA